VFKDNEVVLAKMPKKLRLIVPGALAFQTWLFRWSLARVERYHKDVVIVRFFAVPGSRYHLPPEAIRKLRRRREEAGV
jgi:hypothetical protein